MITSGAQIRAGRALLRWSQSQLAQAAGIHRNAVFYWERKTAFPAGAQNREPHAVQRMRFALEAAGSVVFPVGIART